MAGHDLGLVAGRVPGRGQRRRAVHLQHRRLRRRRHAQVPDRDGLRRDERRHPDVQLDFAWTNYGTGNVNTSEVDDIISGASSIDQELDYGEYIGQNNNGNHTALFQDVDTYLQGLDMPAAVVDHNGNFMGWAMFHVTSASAGSDKHIRGYFMSSFTSARLRVSSCAANACPRYLGTYVLKLSD